MAKTESGRAICPKCDRGSILYRQREPHYWCRLCGWEGNEPRKEQAAVKGAAK